ncbi:MAG: UvrD-helicase domain-containing protein [Hyphomicrobiales bacterium]
MPNRLVLASAGAGKTQIIIDDAVARANAGQKVLILTYTENNQKELRQRVQSSHCQKPQNIKIKGWFTFLLEDMVRPYQECVFPKRVSGLWFNTVNPHIKNSAYILGRKEKNKNGDYNCRHFVTEVENKAHSMFLAKLAFRICEISGAPRKIGRKTYKIGLPIPRLEKIYDAVFIDEVQDLAGYDYDILKLFSACEGVDIVAVGDFRQTIYKTSHAKSSPITSADKINFLKEHGFTLEPMAISRRCIQSICDFADLIHQDEGFEPTVSQVDEGNLANLCGQHFGVFAVRSGDAEAYLRQFKPTILRRSISDNPILFEGFTTHNFGVSKGLGFDRCLIFPTEAQQDFLSGNCNAFAGQGTDESRNKMYVAVTRARHSVAFLYDGECGLDGIDIWVP